MTLRNQIIEKFHTRFKRMPRFLVRAPGRVNLIGEHTDYNDGFVMPMAIDRYVWIAMTPRLDTMVQAYSADFDQMAILDIEAIEPKEPGWAEYLKGVAWSLRVAGYSLCGWDGIIAGDIPINAGLSSSAALEMALMRAFSASSDLEWEPDVMARIGQRAENEWVGVRCGIMDQMISAGGKAGCALLIDCRSLETRRVPIPSNCSVVVLDTATRRGLVDSAYNERRAQCEKAAHIFGVRALRDVPLEAVAMQPDSLDDLIWRRARHVISENARTLAAADLMVKQDAGGLGKLLYSSHISLRDDFEVSSYELDSIVDCAMEQEGCYGARMTGAGFGGCAIAITKPGMESVFAVRVSECYENKTGNEPAIYICNASDGASLFML